MEEEDGGSELYEADQLYERPEDSDDERERQLLMEQIKNGWGVNSFSNDAKELYFDIKK